LQKGRETSPSLYIRKHEGSHLTVRFNNNSPLVLCFLLGNSPVSEFYMPTFRNTLFHLHRRVGMNTTRWNRVCYETSAYKIQTPGNYPEESIQHSEHGESLKSRIFHSTGHNVIVFRDIPHYSLHNGGRCVSYN